jgi:hypothetical protein
MLNKIFKNEMLDYQKSLERQYDKMFYQLKQNEMYNNIAKKILEDTPSCYIALFGESKSGTSLVAAINHDTIFICDKNNSTSKLYYKIYNDNGIISIEIIDIVMSTFNDGYGSLAMITLLKYAKSIKAQKIWGKLSSKDDDHKKERDLFYKKFRFMNDGLFVRLNLQQ